MSQMPMMGGPPPGMMGPPGMGPMGPPPGPPPEPPEPQMSPADHLRAAIEHAQAALVTEPDDVDSGLLSKAIQILYQLAGNRQKEQQQQLGMSPAVKAMARGR